MTSGVGRHRRVVQMRGLYCGDHAVGRRVGLSRSAGEVVMVGIFILLVIVFVVVIPLLTGWVPGLG
jgi:hypothetical protein